jgi:DNA-binding MarR family transcriptional regulator
MADGARPNAAEPTLGDLHLAVSRRLRAAYAAALEPYGVSPHHARALRAIREHGAVRPGRLAEALRIAPRSVTDVIDDLEGRGLVSRAADPDDRRALRVTLTAAGEALLAEVDSHRTDAATELFGTLSVQDRQELARILALLLQD